MPRVMSKSAPHADNMPIAVDIRDNTIISLRRATIINARPAFHSLPDVLPLFAADYRRRRCRFSSDAACRVSDYANIITRDERTMRRATLCLFYYAASREPMRRDAPVYASNITLLRRCESHVSLRRLSAMFAVAACYLRVPTPCLLFVV